MIHKCLLILIRNIIGAESTWVESNDDVYSNFASTGDWMHNSAPDLAAVVDAGVGLMDHHLPR